MLEIQPSSVLFIYDFRIIPELFTSFQEWAKTKGMKYWEKQEGVIRYQTFRRQTAHLLRDTADQLKGLSKKIDVFSEVEIQNQNSLERILNSTEFQKMQNELLNFVESGSLSHSVLHRAYDSTETMASTP